MYGVPISLVAKYSGWLSLKKKKMKTKILNKFAKFQKHSTQMVCRRLGAVFQTLSDETVRSVVIVICHFSFFGL